MRQWIKRLLLITTVSGLLISNALTLTSAAFNAALSGLVGTTLGVRTVSGMMQTTIAGQKKTLKKQALSQARHKAATRKFGTRLARRTQRVALKSIAAIPAESIPFIGVGVLIADTGYELYAACKNINDLDQLYRELGITEAAPEDVMQTVCQPELPAAGDVWGGVVEQSSQWWDALLDAV